MSFAKNEIITVIEEMGIPATILSENEYATIIRNIEHKYADISKETYSLWEKLRNSASIHDPMGWKLVSDFIKEQECILFLDQANLAVRLENGYHLVILLENTFGFVFYLTDSPESYLLCFNDHDYLIACGAAIGWLQTSKLD